MSSKKQIKVSPPKKAAKKEVSVKEIAEAIRNSYDPSKTTAAGHAKFARMKVDELGGINISYKEGKGLFVEPMRFVKLSVDKLDKESLSLVVEQLETLKLISKEIEKLEKEGVEEEVEVEEGSDEEE